MLVPLRNKSNKNVFKYTQNHGFWPPTNNKNLSETSLPPCLVRELDTTKTSLSIALPFLPTYLPVRYLFVWKSTCCLVTDVL